MFGILVVFLFIVWCVCLCPWGCYNYEGKILDRITNWKTQEEKKTLRVEQPTAGHWTQQEQEEVQEEAVEEEWEEEVEEEEEEAETAERY